VGATGSGKSTLAELLVRTYDPDRGRILLDGVDIREISLDALHTAVGFVPQETFLFSATLRENVLLGAPDDEAARRPRTSTASPARRSALSWAARSARSSETETVTSRLRPEQRPAPCSAERLKANSRRTARARARRRTPSAVAARPVALLANCGLSGLGPGRQRLGPFLFLWKAESKCERFAVTVGLG